VPGPLVGELEHPRGEVDPEDFSIRVLLGQDDQLVAGAAARDHDGSRR
jgi:hypothetical protein